MICRYSKLEIALWSSWFDLIDSKRAPFPLGASLRELYD